MQTRGHPGSGQAPWVVLLYKRIGYDRESPFDRPRRERENALPGSFALRARKDQPQGRGHLSTVFDQNKESRRVRPQNHLHALPPRIKDEEGVVA